MTFKNLLFAISLFFLCLLAPKELKSQIDTVSITALELKGNVKKITEFNFFAIDSLGKIVNGDYIKAGVGDNEWKFKSEEDVYKLKKSNITYEFDKNGNLLTEISYYSHRTPHETTNYLYQNGLITEYNTKMVFSDAVIKIKVLCKYDSNKNLISKISYRNDEMYGKETFKYDLNNNIIEINEIDEEGNVTIAELNKYGKNKLVYHKKNYSSSSSESHYEYDSLGNKIFTSSLYKSEGDEDIQFIEKSLFEQGVIKRINYLRNGELSGIETYEYSDGKIQSETYYSEKYPQNNSITEYKYFPDGKKEILIKDEEGKKLKEFNKNENIVRLQFISTDEKIEEYTYEYSYDGKGNWIKIIEFRNTIPIKIRTREIQYQ
jgi:antitoxin component YwqK of YwqJK toxin-antitoxin module